MGLHSWGRHVRLEWKALTNKLGYRAIELDMALRKMIYDTGPRCVSFQTPLTSD